MENKKTYVSPLAEVTLLLEEDILTTSGGFSGEDEDLLSLIEL